MIHSKNIERIADILMDDKYNETKQNMENGIVDRLKLELEALKKSYVLETKAVK